MTATFTLAELRSMGYAVVGDKLVRVADCRVVNTGSEDRTALRKVAGLHPPSPASDSGPRFKSQAERIYADRLTSLQRAGDIKNWRYEAVTLRLADDVRHTPDFLVELWDDPVMELHEVKGQRTWEQARVKLKVCANAYPGFRYKLVKVIGGHVESITDIRTLSGGN
jgi:hypothetical protein